jgi:hypothetical protein
MQRARHFTIFKYINSLHYEISESMEMAVLWVVPPCSVVTLKAATVTIDTLSDRAFARHGSCTPTFGRDLAAKLQTGNKSS